jgi:hypothetical protein
VLVQIYIRVQSGKDGPKKIEKSRSALVQRGRQTTRKNDDYEKNGRAWSTECKRLGCLARGERYWPCRVSGVPSSGYAAEARLRYTFR